jgi:hypothetical protein
VALTEPPVRLCCGQRHAGSVCPDGLVACCICFARVPVSGLAVVDGSPIDVCLGCQRREETPPGYHDCGHLFGAAVPGCGGCDPGAIEFYSNDGDPTLHPWPPPMETKEGR